MFRRWFGKTVYVVVGYWLEDLVKHSVAVFEDYEDAVTYKIYLESRKQNYITDKSSFDIVKIVETKVR